MVHITRVLFTSERQRSATAVSDSCHVLDLEGAEHAGITEVLALLLEYGS